MNWKMRSRSVWLAMLVLVLLGVGCNVRPRGVSVSELRGWTLSTPLPKVDFTLNSMHGEPYSFREQTDGHLTLLFFGYTYCPDICPVHMANIAAVKRKLDPEIARDIRVVFVSTDPERDTPERLREWLGHFDDTFVGLYGPLEEVNEIQRSIGLGASFKEDLPTGGYGVAHAAQVVAYTNDNLAHVMYAFGTRQEDWAHDLPKLVTDGPPRPESD